MTRSEWRRISRWKRLKEARETLSLKREPGPATEVEEEDEDAAAFLAEAGIVSGNNVGATKETTSQNLSNIDEDDDEWSAIAVMLE